VTAPPRAPGTYVLFLRLDKDAVLDVGRLGRVTFPSGDYVYVGSARGPGGLAARLARHRNPHKSRHWHIDYLTAVAQVTGAWWAVGDERRECAWATALVGWPGAQVVSPGLGASDCRCRAHLFRLDRLAPRVIIPDGIVLTVWERLGA